MKGRVTIRKAVGDDGEYVETPVFYIDNREVTEAEFRAAFPDAPVVEVKGPLRTGKSWPLISDALGVHPKQVAEAIESARAKGVPTEFTAKGQPIFTSRAHRTAYCRVYGFYDRNGGYGDAAPRNR